MWSECITSSPLWYGCMRGHRSNFPLRCHKLRVSLVIRVSSYSHALHSLASLHASIPPPIFASFFHRQDNYSLAAESSTICSPVDCRRSLLSPCKNLLLLVRYTRFCSFSVDAYMQRLVFLIALGWVRSVGLLSSCLSCKIFSLLLKWFCYSLNQNERLIFAQVSTLRL